MASWERKIHRRVPVVRMTTFPLTTREEKVSGTVAARELRPRLVARIMTRHERLSINPC